MQKLSSALVLNKYILSLFGVKGLDALSENLKDAALEGYDENNVSNLYYVLVSRMYGSTALTPEMLYQYDQNIFSHTQVISRKRTEPIRWKYFQYLSLLFTEIYLDKYFSNRAQLLKDLNVFLQGAFLFEPDYYKELTSFRCDGDVNDLNKLAYWNATGSGKTLLMHVNILQYQHYLKKHNQTKDLNRIIVLTPNEGLSKQHLKEFTESGMEAELFDKTAGSLFRGSKIEIIDIHKLEETSGDKTVAVESFEGNNLVLVDEGHRGAGGEIWKDKRNRLCEQGFSFEYSATFGQSVSALSGAKQKALIDEYGKATLFDYSYRYFYNDGYGKDFQILNISEDWSQSYVELYLTACLLSFYEQMTLFRDHGKEVSAYNIEKPLAIFVGSKVTAVRTDNKKQVSDVIQVLKFIEGFVRNPENSIRNIERLLNGKDGLNDAAGRPIFRNSFKYIQAYTNEYALVYNGLLKQVFNSDISGAFLHLDNLKGQDGEIGLRIGSGDYFGVINVGDDAKLLKLCADEGISTDDKEFSSSLFHSINSRESNINILIGSKKFSEGWSSWRVSTMGLMNIGRGEGSEIIQLFGRGVRLKGYKFSLKRSSALDESIKTEKAPKWLPLLESLNIFGIRADYMQQFREILEGEGVKPESEYEEISINIMPAITNLAERKLKYIKVKDGVNFKKEQLVEKLFSDNKPKVQLNWYPKVQLLKSGRATNVSEVVTIEEGKLAEHHLAFLDWDRIYFELEKFKNERSWYNLNLTRDELRSILYDNSWYTLQIPSAELELTNYEKVNQWQEIAVSLLKSFCERVYNYEKNRFYSDKLETAILDERHPNFEFEYKLLVKKNEEKIISKIKSLKELVHKKEFQENFEIAHQFEAVYNGKHLYYPLFYLENGIYKELVKIQPVALNKGERDFVNDIKVYLGKHENTFVNKKVYLLRNLSKKGIGFFEANNFYPDFILWISDGSKQKVAFIDPKGLRQIQGIDDPKIQLHKRIRTETQPKLGDPDIELYSFIISNTPYDQIKHWKDQGGISDFNKMNVLFQLEQRDAYVDILMNTFK